MADAPRNLIRGNTKLAGLLGICGYLTGLEPGQVRAGLSLVAWIWIPAWVRVWWCGGCCDEKRLWFESINVDERKRNRVYSKADPERECVK